MSFCFNMQINPRYPTYQQICADIEYVTDKTVANQLSHIRTYLRKCQVPTNEVDNFRVRWALNAVNRDTEYIPNIKIAFPVTSLQQMVMALPKSEQGNIIKVAILMMFYAALRQSEVLPHSVATYDSSRHLSRADVTLTHDSIRVVIEHAKNPQTVYQQKSIVLQASPNQELCIVHAVKEMLRITPTQSPSEAFTLFNNSRRPVTVEFFRKNWVKHLKEQWHRQ